jgi:O-antigen/teichoic acid export membrane protein
MSISRNAAYNVIGAAFPSILTLVTVPLYLSFVGLERYGVLTLCWVILGYSGFLDVGLGLAVARRVATTKDDPEEANRIFWTAASISLVTGAIGAVGVYFGAQAYFLWAGASASAFQAELAGAVPILAATVPLLMAGGVLTGVLQGRERFLALNLMGLFGNSLMAIFPLLAAFLWGPDLRVLVAAALAARLLPFPLGAYVTKRALPIRAPTKPSARLVPQLLGFSGWVSVTIIANTIISTVDRLAIGSRIGAAAVPIYAIPYSLVSRVILVPHSLSAALFPRFAEADEAERRRLATSSLEAAAVLITPAIILIVGLTEPFFRLWIGAELATAATPVAYVLAAGFWFYCIGHMTYSMLQATGRPDLVAKVLLAELLPFAAALLAGLHFFGVVGAAAAVTLRSVADAIIFLLFAGVFTEAVRRLLVPAMMVVSSVAAMMLLRQEIAMAVVAVLLASSTLWSMANAPEMLQPMISRLPAPLQRLLARVRVST